MGWKPKILDFVINFVQSNDGFESIDLTFLIFCIIGIFKHIRATSTSDTCFDIIKFEINYNFILKAFCKSNRFAFFISKVMFHVVHISLCILKDKMTNKKM
jgi:hypothetical protein